MDVMVIGYGSLMSGAGLSSSGPFHARSACIVALDRCARGFAKLSRDGDRLAADLDVDSPPLTGRIMSPACPVETPVETMGLTVPLEDLERVSKREGYRPAALRQAAEAAQAQGLGLAEFLWNIDAEGAHDLVAYRRRLLALTGYTSPHYIPHPVRIGEHGFALVFLASGFEGTGSDDVISVRQRTGMRSLLSTAATWRQRSSERQLTYFLSCILGGAHGIGVQDLLASVANEPALAAALRRRLNEMLPAEVTHLPAIAGLSQAQYRQAFGDPEVALRRSGLQAFLGHGMPPIDKLAVCRK